MIGARRPGDQRRNGDDGGERQQHGIPGRPLLVAPDLAPALDDAEMPPARDTPGAEQRTSHPDERPDPRGLRTTQRDVLSSATFVRGKMCAAVAQAGYSRDLRREPSASGFPSFPWRRRASPAARNRSSRPSSAGHQQRVERGQHLDRIHRLCRIIAGLRRQLRPVVQRIDEADSTKTASSVADAMPTRLRATLAQAARRAAAETTTSRRRCRPRRGAR